MTILKLISKNAKQTVLALQKWIDKKDRGFFYIVYMYICKNIAVLLLIESTYVQSEPNSAVSRQLFVYYKDIFNNI